MSPKSSVRKADTTRHAQSGLHTAHNRRPLPAAFAGILMIFLEGDPGWSKTPPDDVDRTFKWELSGEVRGRYETLSGQFRSDRSDNDQALFFRTLVHLKAVHQEWIAGVEIQDSRSYLTDSGSAISTSYVNALDFLQLYLELPVMGFFGSSYDGSLKLGRQTLSIGSKRQIERVTFANVIKNYTGLYLSLKNQEADEWHFFLASPLEIRPNDFDDILDNDVELDQEEFNRVIWGVHYRKADAFPNVLSDVWSELFAYGLHESDNFGNDSPNRHYATPGFRLYRAPTLGHLNFDIEGALRFGNRRATSDPADTENLDVLASMLIAKVGYTFDHAWQPNLAIQYYWASGDDDPSDGRFDQYERLFGARRTDLNNTSLHGPLTPANLSAPSLRFEMAPTDNTTFRIIYTAAFLASKTDAFIIGRQRDPEGESGNFVGHLFDTRFTCEFDDHWELELGASVFLFGEFTKNNPQAPEGSDTVFAYAQLLYSF